MTGVWDEAQGCKRRLTESKDEAPSPASLLPPIAKQLLLPLTFSQDTGDLFSGECEMNRFHMWGHQIQKEKNKCEMWG